MFFKKKKWYLISWRYCPDGYTYHETVKAKNKAEAWNKIASQHFGIFMVEVKEYEYE